MAARTIELAGCFHCTDLEVAATLQTTQFNALTEGSAACGTSACATIICPAAPQATAGDHDAGLTKPAGIW